jgi:predicted dinucleotide-binding enzyme
MSEKEVALTEVIVVIGAGSIGQAIARRVSAGKHVLLADTVAYGYGELAPK